MNAFLSHFSFEFRTGIRNRTLLFLTYLFPLLVYAILGALMTAVNPFFLETMIPAMIIFAVLSGTLISIPDTLVSARKAGIFRSYRINGVPSLSILLTPALSTLIHLIIVSAIIAFSASAFFNAPLPVNWAGFLLTFLLITAACASLSLLIGVISTSSQMTILWAQLIFLPSMILGGLMMPTSVLPAGLARIGLLLPTTYAMKLFSGLAYHQTPEGGVLLPALILLTAAVLAFALALYLFTWDAPDSRQRKRMFLSVLAMLPYILGAVLAG
jgi:ABC-2 type transport system permease protein